MAGTRGSMIKGRVSGRPIPKRGQVKVGIVVGLANSVASIFSRTRPCAATAAARLARIIN